MCPKPELRVSRSTVTGSTTGSSGSGSGQGEVGDCTHTGTNPSTTSSLTFERLEEGPGDLRSPNAVFGGPEPTTGEGKRGEERRDVLLNGEKL